MDEECSCRHHCHCRRRLVIVVVSRRHCRCRILVVDVVLVVVVADVVVVVRGSLLQFVVVVVVVVIVYPQKLKPPTSLSKQNSPAEATYLYISFYGGSQISSGDMGDEAGSSGPVRFWGWFWPAPMQNASS